ncbi:Efflux pump membrane transporter BepE [Zhongshania aliphaticivorans]|uniref:Efflux pump membrane transporter n=1 Tax=Zhongshania aliphaticivorans TaxID=1470434 RepID=A0A5S9NEY0_9GAMM|nr:multidrug efflux RND transporter permease subunit [Zhongshania aliphaticivorans]CAA0087051.1 Efflux pump membrane transporter BepE [Zhongshania aliphaticivorans]CAA0113980.1 Efflux pump membrane transporter BepE [Zhongshania aliphaticivorans]
MNARFFIDRPVLSIVISLMILLGGATAMGRLPISLYPEFLPPEIVVTATYPGASAETIADTVAAPLEQQINGVDDMLYMSTQASASGVVTINVVFATGTDPDQAAINVSNRVAVAENRLPEAVTRLGIQVSKRSTSILMIYALTADHPQYDSIYLSNYALLNIVDELRRLPGIGDARLLGAKDYSMRVWLQPDRLAEFSLTPSDVAQAIREQNANFAAGKFAAEPLVQDAAFTYTVTTQGRLTTVAEFEDIILRTDNSGATLHLGDVARVELGAQDYAFQGAFNGQPAVPIAMYLQPGANALETAKQAQEVLETVREKLPDGVKLNLTFDTTVFVEHSIKEVIVTFFEALVLVVLVMFIFLQNVRATIIPLLAIPVSIIGTFAGLYIVGFSINLLTLFGLILAIGIVVDDAIIVIENVERIMEEQHVDADTAVKRAMEEVSGPLIAIVLVLCAVFLPVIFMDGLTGEMYRQFAVSISVSVILSGIVALTLTPALCSMLLKDKVHPPAVTGFLGGFNRWFGVMRNGYVFVTKAIIEHRFIGLSVFAGLMGLLWYLFQIVPTSLVPSEDQGYVIMAYKTPPAASLSRTKAVTDVMNERVLAQDDVSRLITFSGFDLLSSAQKTNSGVSFIMLKDWSERQEAEQSSTKIAASLPRLGGDLLDGQMFAFNPPPIIGLSTTGGFEVFVQNRGDADFVQMNEQLNAFLALANQQPELVGVYSTFDINTPQYRLNLDREKAMSLGVPVADVFSTMQATFGSLYVNDFTLYGRSFQVNLQSEEDFRTSPDDLGKVFVRASSGSLVPLRSLIQIERIVGPDTVSRFNGFPAAKVLGNPAEGYSSGDALAALERVAAQALGQQFSLGWIGSAYQEKASDGSGSQAFLLAVLMVFLILAAQYERWVIPAAVILAVPFALLGAILATWMRGLENDIYFQIGLVCLIGLASKNAILIVEFAMQKQRQGMTIIDSAVESIRLRFRPIVMTSLAFTLGCLPLAISSGAGAASRMSLGTGVIGGMLIATFVATVFVPLFYVLLASLGQRLKVKN